MTRGAAMYLQTMRFSSKGTWSGCEGKKKEKNLVFTIHDSALKCIY